MKKQFNHKIFTKHDLERIPLARLAHDIVQTVDKVTRMDSFTTIDPLVQGLVAVGTVSTVVQAYKAAKDYRATGLTPLKQFFRTMAEQSVALASSIMISNVFSKVVRGKQDLMRGMIAGVIHTLIFIPICTAVNYLTQCIFPYPNASKIQELVDNQKHETIIEEAHEGADVWGDVFEEENELIQEEDEFLQKTSVHQFTRIRREPLYLRLAHHLRRYTVNGYEGTESVLRSEGYNWLTKYTNCAPRHQESVVVKALITVGQKRQIHYIKESTNSNVSWLGFGVY